MLSFFLFSSIGKVPQAPLESNEPAITTATTLATESSGEMVTLLTVDTEKLITSVILNDLVYGITSRNIVASADGTTFSLPGEEVALFATAMDDLRLIFIYTESGKLLAWSPIAKTFVESALALPDNADVIAIDTYLTYLYVLDNVNNQVHRFPRAEGGFGDRLAWFKESVVINDDAHLAVNETLFLSPNPSTINGFFRGRSTSNFDVPEGGLSVTDLYTRPGLQHVYALDAENHQIIVWNQAGQIIKRLTHEKFAEGKTLTVNEKTTEIFISTENALLSYTMP